MAENYNKKLGVHGEFHLVGKQFKPQSESTQGGEKKIYPDRFELYLLYCDKFKDGLYMDEPFLGKVSVTLESFLKAKAGDIYKGSGTVFGSRLTITELDGMTIVVTDKETPEERLQKLIAEQGLSVDEKENKNKKGV